MNKINFQNLPNTTTPINATNMNLLQTNVENALNEATIGTVLWENPNPGDSNGFSGQTVTLSDDISNYRAISIQFRGYYGSTYSLNTGILPPINAMMIAVANIMSRRLMTSITGTSATFGNGESYETYNGTPSTVNLCYYYEFNLCPRKDYRL